MLVTVLLSSGPASWQCQGYSWGPSQSPEPLSLSNNPTKQDALPTLGRAGRSQQSDRRESSRTVKARW